MLLWKVYITRLIGWLVLRRRIEKWSGTHWECCISLDLVLVTSASQQSNSPHRTRQRKSYHCRSVSGGDRCRCRWVFRDMKESSWEGYGWSRNSFMPCQSVSHALHEALSTSHDKSPCSPSCHCTKTVTTSVRPCSTCVADKLWPCTYMRGREVERVWSWLLFLTTYVMKLARSY